MRLLLAFFLLLNFYCSSEAEVRGQAVNSSLIAEGLEEYSVGENIYVHYNTSILFPGEYFLYSVYNLKWGSGEVSVFSKIAYVEMIGEDNEVIFRQKVKLENGRGSADFFIPTDTPSGSYKILAYTNWMKNFKNAFFEGNLVVINPYQSNQKKILGKTYLGMDEKIQGSIPTMNERNSWKFFELELKKNIFENRERVEIIIKSKNKDVSEGRYSLSVRKKGSILSGPERIDPSVAIKKHSNNYKKHTAKKFFLPELRGQLISGRIISENNSISLEDQKVALSIPFSEDFVQISLTNSKGQFFFNLDREYRDGNVVLEIMGDTRGDLEIRIDKNEGLDINSLNFSSFSIGREMEEEILRRSLHNQIENAYFSLKPDTLLPVRNEIIFPQNLVETYNLNEYTRFKGVAETFVEIIKSAWVKREGKDKKVFEVNGLSGNLPMRLQSLVMVDGILVQDHSALLNYDARRIQTIKIIRDKIYLGPEIFQGAILVKTIEEDFPEEYFAPTAQRVELVHPEVSKRYFQQVYTANNVDSRIPDYRYQLLWQPSFKPSEGEGIIQFYTSDVDGDFEVVLEGFTGNGEPVSVHETFAVD